MNGDMETMVEEDAATWLARLQCGNLDDADRQRFDAWRYIPSHAAAFEVLSALYGRLDAIGAEQPLLAAREAALRRASRRPTFQKIAITAAIALAGVTGSWFVIASRKATPAMTEQIVSTQVGQGATTTLADKSRVTLDADTQIAVSFGGEMRHIRLMRGRAYFEVAKDAARTFVVTTPFGTVRATGTAFSVGTRSDELDVVLREGGVRVALGAGISRDPSAPIAMLPGTKLTANARGWTLRPVPSDNALAWTQGFVVFDNERLRDAVEELNAYSNRKIVLHSGLVDRRISGTFRAGRQDDFAQALSAYGIAKIEKTRPDAIILATPEK